jgi:small redox-active disulfide protein 2
MRRFPVAVTKVMIGGNPVGVIGLEDIFSELKSEGLTDTERTKDLILKKVKVNNYIPRHLEDAYRQDLFEEYRVYTGEIAQRQVNPSHIEVRLYGSACFRCERLDEMVKEILSRAGIPADYLHVTDMREIAAAGIISTPAIAVTGKVILSGQVPEETTLEKILLRAVGRV